MTEAPPDLLTDWPLDLGGYAPFYINTISNRISASASRTYLARFGIGIAEWRVLANLGGPDRACAAQLAEFTGMDKSVVSRALAALERRGCIRTEPDPGDTRRRRLRLTAEGHALRERMIQVALEREARLLSGLTAEERAVLIGLLRRLNANVGLVTAD